MTFLTDFWQNEHGPGLIERRLLRACIALSSAVLFLDAGQSNSRIQSVTNI